jgi:hypothetical protein
MQGLGRSTGTKPPPRPSPPAQSETRPMPRICPKCQKREREYFEPCGADDEGYLSPYCGPCADREYEAHQERREFDYYHPKD